MHAINIFQPRNWYFGVRKGSKHIKIVFSSPVNIKANYVTFYSGCHGQLPIRSIGNTLGILSAFHHKTAFFFIGHSVSVI